MFIILMTILLSKHPSAMCMSLVSFCVFLFLYLKSLISSMSIYIIAIIFIGGILLLLFYLTMISTNKPSWYGNFFLAIIFMPELLFYKNLKFSTSVLFLEMFNYSVGLFLVLILLLFMLFMISMMFSKIMFMRQLN